MAESPNNLSDLAAFGSAHTTPEALPRRTFSLAVVRRKGWLLALCVVLAGVGGLVDVDRSSKTYSATATLFFQNPLITEEIFGNFATSATQDPTTAQANDVALAEAPEIAVRTAAVLGRTYSAGLIAREVAVRASGASDLVNLTATASNPRSAARVANAYAAQTVAYQIAVQRTQINEAASQLSAQIDSLPSGNSSLPQLRTRLAQLEAIAALQTGNVQITANASVPTAPSGPNKKKGLALAVLLGLLVGSFAMLFADRVDSTISEREEITELMSLPVVGSIPAARDFARNARSGTALAVPSIADAFRLLVMQLTYFNVDRELRSLLVTSAGVGDGKSTVAWGLASTAARIRPDARVLLLDTDLRRPRVAELTGVPYRPGLTEAIVRRHGDLSDVIHRVALDDNPGGPTMDVMTAGTEVLNPSELLSSASMRGLLSRLNASYSLVIIDAAPTTLVPDAIPLLNQVSGVLVVARVGVSKRPGLRALANQLAELGVPMFGVVANAVPKRRADTYSGYYGGYART
jgi:capsular exopolysaccharide synthesis family protein